MKLLILLLSDIHLRSIEDKVIIVANKIAASVFPQLRNVDKCLIIVTGDITNAGLAEEFEVAELFLNEIKSSLEAEARTKVDVLTVPGNHDCLLRPENPIRNRLIESILKNPSDAHEEAIVDACTEVQKNYFVFRSRTTTLLPVYEDKLWSEYEVILNGHPIRFSSINASWMSSIHEKPGNLVFPIDEYSSLLKEPSHARFVLMHHPLNWYAQGTYHPLRVAIRSFATAVLSGHEHHNSSGLVTENTYGSSLFFEAPALQPHKSNGDVECGYLSLEFNFDAKEIIESQYLINNYETVTKKQELKSSIETLLKPLGHLEGITEEFQEILCQPGADFQFNDQSEVTLDDIYVFPQLQPLTGKEDLYKLIDADELISEDPTDKKILLIGDSSSGRTSLLYQAFKQYRKEGFFPVYLNARDIKGSSQTDLDKLFTRIKENQYSSIQELESVSRSKFILLVDDFDRLKESLRGLPLVLQYIERHFVATVMTATTGYEFNDLLSVDVGTSTKNFRTYRINPFGSWLKHRLIRKWCVCNNSISSATELEAKVHAAEQTLNVILGKNLVPGVPIYILILLQSIEKNQESALTNSHIGSYYGYMIEKSLRDANVKPSKLVEIKRYLSELAWFFKSQGIQECSLEQITAFNAKYSAVQNTVDLSSRLSELIKSRMLLQRQDYYSFTYPYIYYYFLGQYIAKNLNRDSELKRTVSIWCGELHKEDNANAVLFTAHHVNDEWIITRVKEELDKCFETSPAIGFNGDIDAVNQLVQKTSTLIMESPDVESLRERRLKRVDSQEVEDLESQQHKQDTPLSTLASNINKSLITSRILGQILKGYYGEISRADREDLINKIFCSQLRFLHYFMSTLIGDPSVLVSVIESELELEEGQTKEERTTEIRQNVYVFLGLLCTAALERTARNVSSDDLREDINTIVEQNPTNAYRLIKAASNFIRPAQLPFEEIRTFSEDLKNNPFTFGLLQTLAARHMQYFHVKDSDRQKLCSVTKIQLVPPQPSTYLSEGLNKIKKG